MEEISDTQLMKAERREVAQARLEGYILCVILEKKFVWNEDIMGKWFWQSKGYHDLVILKKWIEKGPFFASRKWRLPWRRPRFAVATGSAHQLLKWA